MREMFEELEIWDADPLHEIVKEVAETLDLKLGKVAQPLRVAISGGAISPPIDVTLELVGRERVLNRVDMALKFIEQRVAAQG